MTVETRDVVQEVLKKISEIVTEEHVLNALQQYGDIEVDLLARAVAFDIGVASMGAVREASVAATRSETSLLQKEVRELKEMLDETTDRLAKSRTEEKKLLNASMTCDVCSGAEESVIQSDTSFVEELSAKLGRNYLKD
jgi:hypothetical protein